MSKKIYCHKCHIIIANEKDLVTGMVHLDVFPYHAECFAHDLKGGKSFWLKNQPINSISWSLTTGMFIFIGLLILIFSEGSGKALSIVTLLPTVYRLYSYYFFERHL